MLFCIRLPNFVQIGAVTAELWRHIDFSRWRLRPLNTISGYAFVDVTAFRKSKSQFTAQILLLPVWKNKRPPYWNPTSGLDLDHYYHYLTFFNLPRPATATAATATTTTATA